MREGSSVNPSHPQASLEAAVSNMAEPAAPSAKSLTIFEQLEVLFAPWNHSDAPGLVVGVAHEGRTIFRCGFGLASLEFGVANTPATRMRIGSTSKHFACLLALMLAEEGKIDIDVPIRTYIPELAGPAGDPTLRQLMQHVGGTRCPLDLGFISRGMTAPPVGSALKAMIGQTGRNFAPGEAMIYNNGGYHLLSIVIERVGGAPFEAQIKSRLFVPLGLANTESIPSDHDITPGLATLYIPGADGGWRRGLFPSHEVKGEGALVSTVDDMLRWMEHLRHSNQLGPAGAATPLTTSAKLTDGSETGYGLGLMLDRYRGLRAIHHAGGVIGGTCQMLSLPDEALDVIIIANGAPGANVVRLAEQVVDVVLADRVGEEPHKASVETYADLKGVWFSPETGVVYNVVEQDGQLALTFGCSPQGVALREVANGALGTTVGALSEIRLTRGSDPDTLMIRFGGREASYSRAAPDANAIEAFAQAADAHYASAESGAEAQIIRHGERLVLSVTDGYGREQTDLAVFGPDVAAANSPNMLTLVGLVIVLQRDGDVVTGFEASTMRTRRLPFRRIDKAAS